jgi:hypothetical protein
MERIKKEKGDRIPTFAFLHMELHSLPVTFFYCISRLTLTCEYLQAYDLSFSLVFLLSEGDNYTTPHTKAGFQHLRFAE